MTRVWNRSSSADRQAEEAGCAPDDVRSECELRNFVGGIQAGQHQKATKHGFDLEQFLEGMAGSVSLVARMTLMQGLPESCPWG